MKVTTSFNCEDWKGLLNYLNSKELSGFIELNKDAVLEFQEVPFHKVTSSSLIAGEAAIKFTDIIDVKLFLNLYISASEELVNTLTSNSNCNVIYTPYGYAAMPMGVL